MMLHEHLIKRVHLWSLILIFSAALLDYFSPLQNSNLFNLTPTLKSSKELIFIGILIKYVLKVYGFGWALYVIGERIGVYIKLKEATSIFLVTWFLPFIIYPIFQLLFFDSLRLMDGLEYLWIFQTLEWTFLLFGFVYFIQSLRRNFQIKRRRGIFIFLFIYLMFLIVLIPFSGIVL